LREQHKLEVANFESEVTGHCMAYEEMRTLAELHFNRIN